MRGIVIAAVVIAAAAGWAILGNRSSMEGPKGPPTLQGDTRPPAIPAVEREPAREARRKIVVHVFGGDGKPVTSVVGSLDAVAASGSSASSTLQSTPGADLTFDVAGETDAWVTVTGAFDERGNRLPWGQARYGPLRANETEVAIRLAPTQTVEGQILGPGGGGLGGAKIRVRMDVHPGGAELEGRTHSDGSFVVAGLGDGPYVFEVDPPPGYLTPSPAKVHGGDREIVVRTERGLRPTVRVLDVKGEPVAGASVQVEAIESGPVTSGTITHRFRVDGVPEEEPTTKLDGRFRLPALKPGVPLRLVVTPPDSRDDLAQLRQKPWTPADVNVTLRAGFVVRGRVEDGTHAPVPDTGVIATWGGGGESRVSTDKQGRFEFRSVPRGHVTVRVDAEERVEAVADPATPEVLLVVAPRASLRVVLEEPPARLGKRFRVRLSRGALPGEVSTAFASLEPDGHAQFDGLAAEGRYRLLLGPTDDDRVAYLPAVRPADGEVCVRLTPGKTLTGRILAPSGATGLEARVDDGPILWKGVVHEDGRFEITGVPEGTWIVQASAQSGETVLFGAAHITTGSSADIHVRVLGAR